MIQIYLKFHTVHAGTAADERQASNVLNQTTRPGHYYSDGRWPWGSLLDDVRITVH